MRDDAVPQAIGQLVSVITPVFNSAQYIQQTVECVANQTVKVYEHILIDDGSTDNSLEILNALAKQYPNLVILSQQNSGAGVARNLGVKHASARYIAFLDSDDFWTPEKIEQQINFMERENVLLSYGDYEEVDELSEKLLHRYCLADSYTYKQLLNGCPIGCLTVAYNQQVLGKQYMPLIRRGQDWGLWLAITRDGIVARKYPGCCAKYRLVSSSLSKNKWKKLFDVFAIYHKEEKLGWIKSSWHIFRHFLYVRRKRR